MGGPLRSRDFADVLRRVVFFQQSLVQERCEHLGHRFEMSVFLQHGSPVRPCDATHVVVCLHGGNDGSPVLLVWRNVPLERCVGLRQGEAAHVVPQCRVGGLHGDVPGPALDLDPESRVSDAVGKSSR
jgi:hypothetical protein